MGTSRRFRRVSYLFKGRGRGHLRPTQRPQEEHGPWRRIHPKTWPQINERCRFKVQLPSPTVHYWNPEQVWILQFGELTQRWLQHVSVPLTRPDRLDVGRVDQPPEVVGVVAAVQAQTQANTHHAHHRCDADGVGVAWVPCLEFHTCFEFVGRRDSGLQGDTRNTWGRTHVFTQVYNKAE